MSCETLKNKIKCQNDTSSWIVNNDDSFDFINNSKFIKQMLKICISWHGFPGGYGLLKVF